MWAARYRYDTGAQEGSRRKKKKTQRVRFERCFTSPDVIWFKIKVRRKKIFGTDNALPHGVKVLDLIAEETLQELSYACERVVTASYDNARYGVWYLVHRLEGVSVIPQRVSFREMLDHYPQNITEIPWVLGMGAHKRVKSLSLAKNPHLLMAGPTGTGKSNALASFLLGLMYYSTPEQIKFCLIDLKEGVEFDIYKDSPHLQRPIVDKPEGAIEALREMGSEIDRRMALLRSTRAKDISEYNRARPDDRLPILLTVIDEYAQLVLPVDKKLRDEVNKLVVRISALGRAAGIQIVVCSQYPTKEVIDPQIKINLNLKIVFRTQNGIQSMVVINDARAAALPDVKGRALYSLGPDVFECQIAHVSSEDIDFVLRVARGRAAGLTRLDGAKIEIDQQGVLRMIAEGYEGWIKTEELIKVLKGYGLERSQVLEFLEQLDDSAIESYFVVKERGGVKVSLVKEKQVSEADQVDSFVREKTTDGGDTVGMLMYAAYQEFALREQLSVLSAERFADLMSERFERDGETGKWKGVAIKNGNTDSSHLHG
jgi:DNA polymerase III delta prime subunit